MPDARAYRSAVSPMAVSRPQQQRPSPRLVRRRRFTRCPRRALHPASSGLPGRPCCPTIERLPRPGLELATVSPTFENACSHASMRRLPLSTSRALSRPLGLRACRATEVAALRVATAPFRGTSPASIDCDARTGVSMNVKLLRAEWRAVRRASMRLMQQQPCRWSACCRSAWSRSSRPIPNTPHAVGSPGSCRSTTCRAPVVVAAPDPLSGAIAKSGGEAGRLLGLAVPEQATPPTRRCVVSKVSTAIDRSPVSREKREVVDLPVAQVPRQRRCGRDAGRRGLHDRQGPRPRSAAAAVGDGRRIGLQSVRARAPPARRA